MGQNRRTTIPIWLVGIANLPFGLFGGMMLVTLEQILASRHVPEVRIATVTSIALIPTFANIPLAPILDVGFSRRFYAVALGLAAGLLSIATLLAFNNLALLSVLVFLACLAAALFTAALGGWMGAALPKEADRELGVWFNIGNGGGFGVGALLFISLYRALPEPWGAIAIGAAMVAPLPVLALLPLPPGERKGLRESFGQLVRDIGELLSQRHVLRLLPLLALPCASFALTNMFGGVGNEFHASESLVAAISGIGVTLTVIVASPIAGKILGKVAGPPFYLAIGVIGALFTLSLLLLPRTPFTFAWAVVGENVFQTAAFTVSNAMIFRSIAPDSKLAATQFAVLYGATAAPITYMQAIDGRGYAAGGLGGAFLTDAAVSTVICALLAVPVIRWHRRRAFDPPILPS